MSNTAVVDKLLGELQSKFGAGAVMRANEVPIRPPITSGSLSLDFATGIGGLPSDRVIEVAGDEGSGKTTLGLLSMMHFLDTSPDRVAVIIDTEHKLTMDWVEYLIGVDRMQRVIYLSPDHMEQATNMYVDAVSSGQVGFVLFDSIGGSPTKAATEKEAEKVQVGGNAGAVTKFARLASTHASKYHCLTFCINQVRTDMEGFRRHMCLAGDTPVLTRSGFRPIAELSGGVHELLTEGGSWVKAPVECYGEDEMWEVVAERHGVRRVFRANAPHRWPVRRVAGYRRRPTEMAPTHDLGRGVCPDDHCPLYGQCHCPLYCGQSTSVTSSTSQQRGWVSGRHMMFSKGHRSTSTGMGHSKAGSLSERFMTTTAELLPGDVLITNTPRASYKANELLPWAVAWGFTFGDGTVPKTGYAVVPIHDSAPKDRDILPFFEAFRFRRDDARGKTEVYGMPRGFKKLPPLDEPESLLYSWLAGYFAADGDIDKDGLAGISSSSRENLEFVEDLCARIGVTTLGIEENTYGQASFSSGKSWYYLKFPVGSLPEHFFVLASHRARWRPRTVSAAKWRVVDVRPTGVVEPIYCASVEGTETFTLSDYILTGNTPGGHGFKHACVMRIKLRRVTSDKVEAVVNGEKMVVGFKVAASVIKNQVGAPGRTAWWWFYNVDTPEYGFGIDTLEEIVRLSVATKIVAQSGSWYSHPALPEYKTSGEHKVQGISGLRSLIAADPALQQTIVSETMAVLKADTALASEIAPFDPEAVEEDL